MKIAFLFAGGREARWPDALRGRVPTEFFYGAVELAAAGHDVRCVDAPERPDALPSRLLHAVLSGRLPVRTRGEHLRAVAAARTRLKDAEVIVAASSGHANALVVGQRMGLFPAIPVVGIHCGHVNYPPTGARQRASARVMARQQVVLFAEAERPGTIEHFGLDPACVHANDFGVDVDFWRPSAEPGTADYFLAVGNDGRRDYGTLVEAARDLGAPVKILTKRPLPELPPNVENLRGSWKSPAVDDGQLRDLYRRAVAVIIPLEDSIQPSGQSVALQAMACGRPVVHTRTRGLWTGGSFRDGQEILLVPPADPAALRRAMQRLRDDSPARERMASAALDVTRRSFTIRHFARRLEAVLHRAAAATSR